MSDELEGYCELMNWWIAFENDNLSGLHVRMMTWWITFEMMN